MKVLEDPADCLGKVVVVAPRLFLVNRPYLIFGRKNYAILVSLVSVEKYPSRLAMTFTPSLSALSCVDF